MHATCPPPTLLLHHSLCFTGARRARWDLLIVLAIFYSCATLPLRAAFGDNQVGPFFMFDMGLTVFFLVDIILNFNTGFDDDGIIVMEKVCVGGGRGGALLGVVQCVWHKPRRGGTR